MNTSSGQPIFVLHALRGKIYSGHSTIFDSVGLPAHRFVISNLLSARLRVYALTPSDLLIDWNSCSLPLRKNVV